jgi:hypothetical protein
MIQPLSVFETVLNHGISERVIFTVNKEIARILFLSTALTLKLDINRLF